MNQIHHEIISLFLKRKWKQNKNKTIFNTLIIHQYYINITINGSKI